MMNEKNEYSDEQWQCTVQHLEVWEAQGKQVDMNSIVMGDPTYDNAS